MHGLKKHLTSLGYTVADDASDEQISFIAMKAIEDGKLTTDDLVKFRDAEKDHKAERAEFAKQVGEAAAGAMTGAIIESFKQMGLTPGATQAADDESTDDVKDREALHTKGVDAAKARLADGAGGEAAADVLKSMAEHKNDLNVDGKSVDVKSVYKKFNDVGYEMKYADAHPRRGQVVNDIYGEKLLSTSELENVKFLAFFKIQAGLDLGPVEKQLVRAMIEEDSWCNLDDGTRERNGTVKRKLNQIEKQAWIRRLEDSNVAKAMSKASLLDSSTSGGDDAVPIFYDMRGIVEPLVTAELSGLVTTIDIPRGSTVQNFVMGNVTVVKTAEGTAITPFDATSLISAKTYPVFPASVVIDVGVDFLSDAVPQVGNMLRGRITAAMQQYIDEQIAQGDGTTEPLGILNASNVIDVNPVGGAGAAWQLTDVVNLFFGPNKAHRADFGGMGNAYGMSDTSYARIRSLATGISGDNRLLFGETLDDYKLFGKPVRNPAAVANTTAIFGNFRGYTWYRRQAPQFRIETGGRANALSHIGQVIGRMRNAGAPNLGTYFSLIDDAAT